MNWNTWVRQIHRWLSIAFIVNIVALGQEKPAVWVGLLALLPLALLLVTGLYLFALPYAAMWRSGDASADWRERNGQQDVNQVNEGRKEGRNEGRR